MDEIRELKRRDSPAPKPQALAWAGTTLWLSSRETRRIYALDPETLRVTWETPAPGTPFGMAVVGDELRVLCGETDEDHRRVRRCVPGKGFDPHFAWPCPQDAGSHLSWDGRRLHVSQWYPKKIQTFGPDGRIERIVTANHGICGHTIVDGVFYLATTDAEETTEYWLTRLDPRAEAPQAQDLARIPFQARALAFDGTHFWTNHREANQIVCFSAPR
jgi:hypothetical protein